MNGLEKNQTKIPTTRELLHVLPWYASVRYVLIFNVNIKIEFLTD